MFFFRMEFYVQEIKSFKEKIQMKFGSRVGSRPVFIRIRGFGSVTKWYGPETLLWLVGNCKNTYSFPCSLGVQLHGISPAREDYPPPVYASIYTSGRLYNINVIIRKISGQPARSRVCVLLHQCYGSNSTPIH